MEKDTSWFKKILSNLEIAAQTEITLKIPNQNLIYSNLCTVVDYVIVIPETNDT